MSSTLNLFYSAFYKKVQVIPSPVIKNWWANFVNAPPATRVFLVLVDTCKVIVNK